MGWRVVVALSLATAGCCASTTDEPLLDLDLSEARRLQSATVSGSRLSFGGGACTIELSPGATSLVSSCSINQPSGRRLDQTVEDRPLDGHTIDDRTSDGRTSDSHTSTINAIEPRLDADRLAQLEAKSARLHARLESDYAKLTARAIKLENDHAMMRHELETRSSKLDDMYTQMQAQLRELTERSNGKL